MASRSRSRSVRGQTSTTTKEIARSANSVGKETNQFDETGVD